MSNATNLPVSGFCLDGSDVRRFERATNGARYWVFSAVRFGEHELVNESDMLVRFSSFSAGRPVAISTP